jgi:nitric oxide reductase
MIPGHLTREDVVGLAFLMLVAGNATMVTMIEVVRLRSALFILL